MYSTRVTRHVGAPRPAVYRALLDADAIRQWRVPDGMSSEVHEFDAREGGSFRVSLTYDAPADTGKSAAAPTPTTAASPASCPTSRSPRCSSSSRPTRAWRAR